MAIINRAGADWQSPECSNAIWLATFTPRRRPLCRLLEISDRFHVIAIKFWKVAIDNAAAKK
ncbi:hypothetical protein CQW29_04305 [Pantoea coffeiphila]|uniref:Uncharacterized protein n=1 Tax=Pantoea coffeiphila TaxID=1465635 RepID=A0A2S9IGH7_9GAMM|nr:hypothetical protein CQW29_04305 [Pantoea coffeiphila]